MNLLWVEIYYGKMSGVLSWTIFFPTDFKFVTLLKLIVLVLTLLIGCDFVKKLLVFPPNVICRFHKMIYENMTHGITMKNVTF